MHGAGGGAKAGAAHPNWKHGERSGEAVELPRFVSEMVLIAKATKHALSK